MIEQANLDNLKLFYQFIAERQAIWHRRFVLSLPREQWTQDPILKDRKFTNVYRILDRGSQWPINQIIKKGSKATKRDQKNLFWKLFCYRMINRIETFEETGIPNYWEWDPEDFKDLLEAVHAKGPVFTNAYITCQSSKKQSRIDNAIDMFNDMHAKLEDVYQRVRKSATMREAHKVLQKVYGIGHFTAFQILLDLTYADLVVFGEDDWADVGPGCKRGLKLIFPELDGEDLYKGMVWLRDWQEEAWKEYDIKFYAWEGKRISLSNIENCLCEFSKYHASRNGYGRSRIKFTPSNKRLYGKVATR